MNNSAFALLVCCLLLASCGKGDGATGADANVANTVSDEVSAEANSGWALERQQSAMDGEKLIATRYFEFGDRDTRFEVSLTCSGGKEASMAVESYVGSAEKPDERSGFAAEVRPVGNSYVSAPIGRLKLQGDAPTGLSPYFLVDSAYSNKINLTGWFGQETLRFPMIMEVQNGMGTFELAIDSSPELRQVLDACGLGAKVSETPQGQSPASATEQEAPQSEATERVTSDISNAQSTGTATVSENIRGVIGMPYSAAAKSLRENGFEPDTDAQSFATVSSDPAQCGNQGCEIFWRNAQKERLCVGVKVDDTKEEADWEVTRLGGCE